MKRMLPAGALLLAVLLMLSVLSGCVPAEVMETLTVATPFPSATAAAAATAVPEKSAAPAAVQTPVPTADPTPTPTPTPEPTAEPVFAVRTVLSAGKNLPIVENCVYASEINAGLAALFTPWASWIQQANSSGYPVRLEYASFTKEIDHERYCILYPRLESGDGVYRLPTLTFSPDSPDLPEYPHPAHSGFSDPVYVQALIRLNARGVRIDPDNDPALLLTPERFFWEIENLYTLFTGNQPDAMGSELGDTALARASVLDLISAEEARVLTRESQSDSGFTMEAQYLTSVLSSLTVRILRERSGIYSEQATAQQSAASALSALRVWGYASGLQDHAAWKSTMGILEAMPSGTEDGPLTRLSLASLYVRFYENAFQTIPESQWTTLLDSSDPAARKAHAAYLMTSFPGSRYFCPDYTVAVHDMYEWIPQFVSGFSNRFLRTFPDASAQPLTLRSLYAALGCWVTDLDLAEPQEYSFEEINNARDHEWYVNQYDGSPYAASNCMPAMTAMTLRWLDPTDPATPSSVRMLSDSDAAAWKMRQVEEVLQKENVFFYIRRLDLDQWVRDLDAGCLVLIQTNEGSLSGDGHCLVLYGYRRYGESTTFLAMDPGYSSQTDLFGSPLGKGIELDARYVWMIASRFSSYNLAVRR